MINSFEWYDTYKLTVSEMKALSLLAKGYRVGDIDTIVGWVKGTTAKVHLYRARKKLKAPDNSALLATAIALGLV